MKIFLDIDGVMVPANSWKRPEFLIDGFPAFSKKATSALQKIIDDTNADIVLTSSHKANYSVEEWLTLFKNRGIDLKTIYRLPENISNQNRKEELISWFNLNGIEDNFVIIDDDKILNDLPFFLKERLVLTSGAIGLTDEQANRAIAFLHNKSYSTV